MLDRDPHGPDIREHDRFVRRLAARLVGNAEAADVAQQAWIVALTRPRPSDAALGPWLTGIVKRLSLAYRRRAARASVPMTNSPIEPACDPDPSDLVARTELEHKLLAAVLALPEPRRTITLLHFREDETSVAIGHRLGLPDGTVRWHLKSALDDLRARLDHEHQGNRRAWLPPIAALARGKFGTATTHAAISGGVLSMKLNVAGLASLAAIALLSCFMLLRTDASPVPPAMPVAPNSDSALANEPFVATTSTALVEPTVREPAADATGAATHVLRIRGRAVDRNGAPIADADVATRPFRRDRESRNAAFESRGKSDTDGRFEFALQLEVDPEDPIRLVEHEVRVRRADRVPAVRSTLQPAIGFADHIELGDVVLDIGTTIEGVVVDAEGQGVAGARVFAVESDLDRSIHEFGLAEPERSPSTLTNDRGEFRFDGLASRWLTIVADAKEFIVGRTPQIALSPGEKIERVRIELEALGQRVIEGDCLDAAGKPIPNARISMIWTVGRSSMMRSFQADARGHYLLRAFDDVPRTLTLAHAGETASLRDVRPGNRDANLRLSDAKRAVLHVRDATTHRPIPALTVGAEITNGSFFSSEDGPRLVPDAPGDVRFCAPGTGSLSVRISANGYRDGSAGPFTADDTPAESIVELEPLPGPIEDPKRFLNVIVQSAGQAIAGARVALANATPFDYGGFAVRDPVRDRPGTTPTDAFGRIQIDATHASKNAGRFVILAAADGYAPAESRIFDPSDRTLGTPDSPLFADLQRPGSIEGDVRSDDATSRDVAGLVVAAWREFGMPKLTRVGADGRFRFDGLTPGPWRVEVRARDFDFRGVESYSTTSEHALATPNVIVVAGETVHITCSDQTPRQPTLEGQLFAEPGARPGWTISVWRVDRASAEAALTAKSIDFRMVESMLRTAQVDTAGNFAFDLPGPGTYFVRASDTSVLEGSSTITTLVDVELGTNRIDLALRLGQVEGTYPQPGGAKSKTPLQPGALTGTWVRWSSLRAPNVLATGYGRCDADRRFVLESVPEGEIEIEFWGRAEPIRVTAGETTVLAER